MVRSRTIAAGAPVGRSQLARRYLALMAPIFLVALGATVPAQAGAATRVYKLTDRGFHSESYTLAPNTSNGSMAPAPFCQVDESGDIAVHWKNVWRVTAEVHPRSGHIRIKTIKQTAGPRDRRHPGDSEIQGKNADIPEDSDHLCSSDGDAGRYDCTAEAIVSKPPPLPDFDRQGKGFELTTQGYAYPHANYEGNSPKNWTCARNIGTNTVPGGYIGFNDFWGPGGALSASEHHLVDTDILALKRRKGYSWKVGDAWADAWVLGFPHADDARTIGDVGTETLTYGPELSRADSLDFVRVK